MAEREPKMGVKSNEKRSNVAQKLRDIEQAALKGETTIKKMSASSHLALISETIEKPEGQTLWGRLADLIEPEPERTCRFQFDHMDSNGWSWEACSACHDTFAGFNVNLEFAYCPTCGAKVVEDAN